MKILSVRLLNLNSLVGENYVDFTWPQFEESGIFAIVGPTGSGKTTILDAICLALYGLTPRLPKLSSDNDEIMSKSAGECYAEVLFETRRLGKTERYRVKWSHHRARKKPDGKFQGASHELSNAETDEILETGVSNVPEAVARLTGMTFDQFTRSMMLAQGEFTRFLKSNKNERGDILEKITGTQVYGEISKMVFTRNKDEENRLATIREQSQGITLLDAEETAALSDKLKESEKKKTELRNRVQLVQSAIRHLDRLEKLRQNTENLRQEWETHEIEAEAFAPLDVQLTAARRALEVEGIYVEYTGLQTQRENRRNTLQKSEALLPKAKTNFDLAYQQDNAAEEKLKTTKNRQEAEKPTIKAAYDLEAQIRLIDGEIAKAGHRVKQCQNDVSTHQNGLTKSEGDFMKQFPGDSFLEMEKEKSRLATLLAEQPMADLLREQREGQAELKTWENIVTAMNKLTELGQSETESTVQRTEAANAANRHRELAEAKRSELDRTRKTCDEIRQRLATRQEIQGYEKARLHLEDGRPCPLCGALEHPFAVGNIPSPDEVKRELSGAEKSCDEIGNALNDLILERTKQENLLEQADKELKELVTNKIRWNEILSGYLFSLNIETPPIMETAAARVAETTASVNSLTTKIDNLAKWQREAEQLEKKLIQGQEAKAEIENKRMKLETAEKELEKQTMEKTRHEESKQAKVDELESLFNGRKPVGVEKLLANDVANAEQHRESARKTLVNAEQFYHQMKNEIESARQAIEECGLKIAVAEPEYRVRLEKMGFTSEADFLMAKLEPSRREELEARKMQLALRKQELETSRKNNTEQLEAEIALIDPETEPVYKLSKEELETEFAELDRQRKQAETESIELQLTLKKDTEDREKCDQINARINEQTEVCKLWSKMADLIGSKNGDKFRVFAQGLTFRMMIAQANEQLRKMDDRYILMQSDAVDHPLDLIIRDTHQADAVRSVENLSGGESFLVSLALALGLSAMSGSQVRVGSLFLDEGFGTLDEKTLNIALSHLEGLREEGKQIGIISHIPDIRNRIAAQIRLKRIRKGQSRIEISFDS